MRLLDVIVPLVAVAAVVLWFAWGIARHARTAEHLKQGGPQLQIRAVIAVIVWILVSAVSFYFGAENYFVLGQLASVIAFFRAWPNRELGQIGLLVGTFFMLSDVLNTLLWFPGFSLGQVLLLDHRIGAIFGGSLAFSYGILVCSVTSYVWGRVAGLPKEAHRNGAPFTVESEAPEHVIQLRRAP